MQTVILCETDDIDFLVAALHDADEDDDRIRALVTDAGTTSYAVVIDGERVGAVSLHWALNDSEILYIAIDAALRGRGVGAAVIARVLDEARRRKTAALLVGTSNASLGTIAFYQKCGFRMDSIRRDYFAYFSEPVYENGIQIRDMLVLRLDVQPQG